MAHLDKLTVVALGMALVCLSPLAFVQPGTGMSTEHKRPEQQIISSTSLPERSVEVDEVAVSTSTVLAMSAALGAVLGFVRARKQQIASTAVAAAFGFSAASANAMVDFNGIQYLGGSDKVDINNANVQAYRQFPGMFPTIAGLIGSNGPYKSVGEVYDIKGMTPAMKDVMKQYEKQLVCLPADPAYFIDRLNNGLYR